LPTGAALIALPRSRDVPLRAIGAAPCGPTDCSEDRVSRSVTRLARRTVSAVAISAAFATLAADSSMAATLQSHSGSIGHVKFTDTSSTPGATCLYEGAAGTQYFAGMTLRAVKVEYPNLNPNVVDHGKVAYQIELEHQKPGQAWQNYLESNPVKKDASDNAFTKFPAQTGNWSGATALGGKWRAEVILTWYNSDNAVLGKGTWTIDNLKRQFNGSVGATCQGRWTANG
jgi:hypothetical protein